MHKISLSKIWFFLSFKKYEWKDSGLAHFQTRVYQHERFSCLLERERGKSHTIPPSASRKRVLFCSYGFEKICKSRERSLECHKNFMNSHFWHCHKSVTVFLLIILLPINAFGGRSWEFSERESTRSWSGQSGWECRGTGLEEGRRHWATEDWTTEGFARKTS